MRILTGAENKHRLSIKKNGHIFALALIALFSFWMNFYAISKIGYGNAYYAAAIKSMTESFHNFFYVAFDPAGLVSVDKPPLGLWIQAIFVLIFGYHGWAMLLPQALAGTASCLMIYILTAKYFGRSAGLISSLVFALTPAVVVASRNNTMDMQLVFVLLVATWFLFKSIEKGKWRYLFLAALFVGIGFNIKMMQAYMILPAVAIVYLIFAKEKFVKRIAAGLISVLIAAVVSFAWVAAVDLTPASQRPYVGSSTNNTEWELIIGHNGLERLNGQGGGTGMGGRKGGSMPFGGQNGNAEGMPNGTPGGQGSPQGGSQNGGPNFQSGNQGGQNSTQNGAPNGFPGDSQDGSQSGNQDGGNAQNFHGGRMSGGGQNGTQGGLGGMSGSSQGQGQNGGQGGGAAGNDIGTAGVFRLWESGLYGQSSWLLVFVLFCILVKCRKINIKQLTLKQGVFVYWILWLATMYVFFSFAGFWHRYYLCMFGPCVAALAGPGLVEMVRAFREKKGWKQFLLPISMIATTAVAVVFVWSYTALRTWLIPLMAVPAVLALALMLVHYFKPKKAIAVTAAVSMMFSLLAAPFYWSLTVMLYPCQNVTMPYAGPELASEEAVQGMTPNQEALTTGDSGTASLESYLVAHYKEGSYLVVSQRADDVAQFIVDTGLPAVAYGGFLGSDNAVTLDQLKELVSEGKVTYFLVTSSGGGMNSNRFSGESADGGSQDGSAANIPDSGTNGGGMGSGMGGESSSELISYVESNATLIDPSEYGESSSQFGQTTGSLYLFNAGSAE